MKRKVSSAIPLDKVLITDGFWAPRLRTNRAVTLPVEYGLLESTGRLEAPKLNWKPGRPNKPHIFWDSDVAKWLEAAAYDLTLHHDPVLEKRCDKVIRLLERAQRPDGYLNTWFNTVEKDQRWTNLEERHELYCMGHLTEAAVAYHQATGKDRFLKTMCRYADHVARTFGRGKGKKRGYCGHPEVELALFRLYKETGNRKYLELSKYFIDERGRRPFYFERERRELDRRGIPSQWAPWPKSGDWGYCQANEPVREQKDAVGHSVRALYLYSGMADVAAETGDAELLRACRRLWESVTLRRMYVTGGVGSTRGGERFTFDYDLPNETAYAETCAAIALVFFSRRMSLIEDDSRYADVMELALYNGVLSGVGLDGKSFLYANPLTVYPATGAQATNFAPGRQRWFDCACCPPNIARLLASLGQYVSSVREDEVRLDLYIACRIKTRINGRDVGLRVDTGYPWSGKVFISIDQSFPSRFGLHLRIPGWCGKFSIRANGERIKPVIRNGYACIKRSWEKGDVVELDMEMAVELIEANPKVRSDCGKTAFRRGPLVYCLEEVDNGKDLADITLSGRPRISVGKDKIFPFPGTVVIKADAFRRSKKGWNDSLYRSGRSIPEPVRIKAIPYALWGNRKPGEMMVWIRKWS